MTNRQRRRTSRVHYDVDLAFDPAEPRDPMGKWVHIAHALGLGHGKPGRVNGAGTLRDPIDVQGNVVKAASLMEKGKYVRLNSVDKVGTMMDRLVFKAKEAQKHGIKDTFNLCEVSVPGTNLFCAQNKGIPRVKMPQLGGVPVPGSPASKLPRSAYSPNEVDVTEQFRAALKKAGIKETDEAVQADSLKATQSELNAVNAAGIAAAMDKAKPDSFLFSPIFVTRDHYIIDGHHRWAAQIIRDSKDGHLGNEPMKVRMLDMDIGEAIPWVNHFTTAYGIAQVGVGVPSVVQKEHPVDLAFDPAEMRDKRGRWVKHLIPASEIAVGDRLDRAGHTRVHTVHPRGDQVIVAHRTTGTRSGSVSKYGKADTVAVFRKDPQALNVAEVLDTVNPSPLAHLPEQYRAAYEAKHDPEKLKKAGWTQVGSRWMQPSTGHQIVLPEGTDPLIAARFAERAASMLKLGQKVTPVVDSKPVTVNVPSPEEWAKLDAVRSAPFGADGVAAFVDPNNAPNVIQVNPRAVVGKGTMPGKIPPAVTSLNFAQLTVLHELGHVVDNRGSAGNDRNRADIYYKTKGAISTYGDTNPLEAYAEAWSEWTMAHQKGTTSPSDDAYWASTIWAKEYGWGWKP